MAKMTDNMDKKFTEMSNAISRKRKSDEDSDTSDSDEEIQAVYAAGYDPDENPFASSDDDSSCGVNMAAATESEMEEYKETSKKLKKELKQVAKLEAKNKEKSSRKNT